MFGILRIFILKVLWFLGLSTLGRKITQNSHSDVKNNTVPEPAMLREEGGAQALYLELAQGSSAWYSLHRALTF